MWDALLIAAATAVFLSVLGVDVHWRSLSK